MPAGGLIAGSIAAPIIGGVIGNITASQDREAAQQAAREAYSQFMSLGYPPDLARQIVFDKLQSVGQYSPDIEQTIDVGQSELAKLRENPEGRAAQMSALELIRQRAQSGLNPQDRAALNQIRNQLAVDAEAKRQQIIQSLAQRGLAGSGSELAAQLSAQQAAQQQASQEGDRIGAAAAQNALQAIGQMGSLGGQLRAGDLDVAQTRASAADAWNKFRLQNAIEQQSRNVASRNQGQLYNLQNAQRIADANTNMANQERLRQRDAEQQMWQNQTGLAGMKSNALLGQANNLNTQAAQKAQSWQTIGSGVGSGLGAGLDYYGRVNSSPTYDSSNSNSRSSSRSSSNPNLGVNTNLNTNDEEMKRLISQYNIR